MPPHRPVRVAPGWMLDKVASAGRENLTALRRKLLGDGHPNVEIVQRASWPTSTRGPIDSSTRGTPSTTCRMRGRRWRCRGSARCWLQGRSSSGDPPGGILRPWDVVNHFPARNADEWIERWCATAPEVLDGVWSRVELQEHVRHEHPTFTSPA